MGGVGSVNRALVGGPASKAVVCAYDATVLAGTQVGGAAGWGGACLAHGGHGGNDVLCSKANPRLGSLGAMPQPP